MEAKTPRNLAESSLADQAVFLQSFDTVLLDCDGVLWSLVSKPVPRSDAAVQALTASKKDIFFLSNNATRSTAELEKKFESYVSGGVKIDVQKQFITPANSIVEYLQKIKFDKRIFLIGSPVLETFLKSHDFDVVTAPNVVDDNTYIKHLMDVASNVGAVVFDSDINLNLIKIHKAEMHLLDPKCLFILGATEKDVDIGGIVLSAPGKFQAHLEDKYPRKRIELGKPGVELGELIADRFRDKKVLFVGDHLESDIKFANRLGFQSLLVLSGCTSKEMLDLERDEERLPDFYLKSLGELADIISNVGG